MIVGHMDPLGTLRCSSTITVLVLAGSNIVPAVLAVLLVLGGSDRNGGGVANAAADVETEVPPAAAQQQKQKQQQREEQPRQQQMGTTRRSRVIARVTHPRWTGSEVGVVLLLRRPHCNCDLSLLLDLTDRKPIPR